MGKNKQPVQSLNSSVELLIDATALNGLGQYGKVMIGNKGFEFYDERDCHKFIQIPWEEVDVVIASIMLKGKWIPRYAGKVMIGNKGFEFYDERDCHKFIQIPWEEVDVVIASIMLKGKWIPRYAVRTKKNGTYTFASKDPKLVLRTIRNHIEAERIVKSLSFFQVVARGVKGIFKKKAA